ncbi:hypothetical protein [Blastococcus sp. SYSU D00820]
MGTSRARPGLCGPAASWGASAAEREVHLPCDDLLPDARLVLHRAVDVDAAPSLLYRWLCQLRAAPYSYDLLDNLGRRSPQRLTPGLEQLAVGQRILTVFRVASFVRGSHVTVEHRGVFGRVAATYRVTGEGLRSRLLVRTRWRPPLPLLASGGATPWGWGDLVMARRQLLNLKALAERDQRELPGA